MLLVMDGCLIGWENLVFEREDEVEVGPQRLQWRDSCEFFTELSFLPTPLRQCG